MGFIESLYEEALELQNAEQYAEAMEKFEETIKFESTEAMLSLGDMFFQGQGMESPDYSKAAQLYEKADRFGNMYAKYSLGLCYYWGFGVPRDLQKALQLFKIAAKFGISPAYYMLGYMYEHGIQEGRNLAKSIKYYKEAAHHHHILANVELANIYHNGIGVEKDDKLAFLYYQYAAAMGNLTAKKELASFYEKGIYVPRNRDKAKELYQEVFDENVKRAQNNDPNAALNLGFIYFEGLRIINIEQNFPLAFQYFEIAAKKQLPNAQNMLGVCYSMGLGVDSNIKEAAKCFRVSAKSGLICAKGNLVECFFNGFNQVDVDVKTAKEMLVEAADMGYPPSQVLLGKSYLEGINGFRKDLTKATQYLTAAKDAGMRSVYVPLAKCKLEGEGLAMFDDPQKAAFELYQEGSELGDLGSKVCLAECYIKGKGTNRDPIEAEDILHTVIGERQKFEIHQSKSVCFGDEQGIQMYITNPLNDEYQSYYDKAESLLESLHPGTPRKYIKEERYIPSKKDRISDFTGGTTEPEESISSQKPNADIDKSFSFKISVLIDKYDYYIYLERTKGEPIELVFNYDKPKFFYFVLLCALMSGKPKVTKTMISDENMKEKLYNIAKYLNIKEIPNLLNNFEEQYSLCGTNIKYSINNKKLNPYLTDPERKECMVINGKDGKTNYKKLQLSQDQVVLPEDDAIHDFIKAISRYNDIGE